MPLPHEELLETVRVRIGAEVRKFLTGGSRSPREKFVLTADDQGLFGPGSATWQVHGDMATTVGAVRALILQTLHPLAIAAVADHSDFRTDPLGRLHRTADFVSITTFGTTAAAEEAIAVVRAVHERVVGIAPDGRPYSAGDPHLLTWIHVAEVDSFLSAYQRYGAGHLDDRRADQYVEEMSRVAERLGAENVPRTVAELKAWTELVRPELRAGRQAREGVRFLLLPPWPLAARPAHAVVTAAAVGLLPGWARRMLWLPTAPLSDALVVRPACLALLRVLGWSLTGPRPGGSGGSGGGDRVSPAA